METVINKKQPKVPPEISEYIKNNFREGFLTEIRKVKDKKGKITYTVDIGEHENLHHIHFNEKGKLLSRETEPLYPEDEREGIFYGED